MIMAVIAALPSAAAAGPKCDDPPCNRPPPEPEEVVCAFDGSGVLTNWDGFGGLRCKWIIPADRRGSDQAFTFQIQPAPDTNPRVLIPYFAVTDVYPNGGDICAAPHESGWHNVPYPSDGDEHIWTFSLDETTVCADNTSGEFALTVNPQKIKGGPALFVWTDMSGT